MTTSGSVTGGGRARARPASDAGERVRGGKRSPCAGSRNFDRISSPRDSGQMKDSVKRFSVAVGFLALLAVLVINVLVTRHQVESQVEAHHWLLHTQQVVLELTQIESL